jgi:hypothetical protein
MLDNLFYERKLIMKKSIVVLMALVIAVACVLTACGPKVDPDVADVSTTDEGGTTRVEVEFIETSPYVNVTDASGNAVTVVIDGDIYYQQILREQAGNVNAPTEVIKIADNLSVGQDAAVEQIKYFLGALASKAFALEGSMESDGELLPIDFAICGDNASMKTSMDNITLKILLFDGETYLVSDEEKTYMALGKAVRKMLGIEDMDLSEMMASFGDVDIDYDTVSTYTEVVDGTMYDVLNYPSDDAPNTGTRFYLANGELVKMVTYAAGGDTSALVVNKLTANITNNDLAIPETYEKIGYIEFLSSLMKAE